MSSLTFPSLSIPRPILPADDEFDNVYCQVSGFKYVRLFPRSQAPFMYRDAQGADVNMDQGNFSQVDVDDPDVYDKFPLFANAEYSEAILGPGDSLYIPWGCWHYFKSITPSFSANFWWKRNEADLKKVMPAKPF